MPIEGAEVAAHRNGCSDMHGHMASTCVASLVISIGGVQCVSLQLLSLNKLAMWHCCVTHAHPYLKSILML